MLEMKITITAADLAAAINNLAAALGGNRASASVDANTPNTSAAVPQENLAPQVPIASTSTDAAPIPTAAPAYTLEMIAQAGTALVDADKMDELYELLAKYGVNSITDLLPSQYGAFATDMRAIGARI